MSPSSWLLLSAASAVGGDFVKGTFHQHASQPYRRCHFAAPGIDACGPGCEREQDDGGTRADAVLRAIANASRGYAFVGLAGNEEPPTPPKQSGGDRNGRVHGLVWLNVTENQMAAVCNASDAGAHKCPKHPCAPVVPAGSGPWRPTAPPINNLHREYIGGVPGVFVQHPQTDPERDAITAYLSSGHDNVRGLEVYNSWVEQAWNATVPLLREGEAEAIDALYPPYRSMAMGAWDAALRALHRPLWGLADDDGFDYTGDSDETLYPHGRRDTVQTGSPAWFRFGMGFTMAQVPDARAFTAADVAAAVDEGRFYASTGLELAYDTSAPHLLLVNATEPVVFGATGGGAPQQGGPHTAPMAPFNLTLCADAADPGVVTNVGCAPPRAAAAAAAAAVVYAPPPAARTLRVDLTALPPAMARQAAFFFVRVQATVRRRYPIARAPTAPAKGSKGAPWTFGLAAGAAAAAAAHPEDFEEGRLVRVAGGGARRPFLVLGLRSGGEVDCVSKFTDDDTGDITPESGVQGTTTIEGITAGRDELVAERWAWLQPVFRQKDAATGALRDPFARGVSDV